MRVRERQREREIEVERRRERERWEREKERGGNLPILFEQGPLLGPEACSEFLSPKKNLFFIHHIFTKTKSDKSQIGI
jgi:hypothetical protein